MRLNSIDNGGDVSSMVSWRLPLARPAGSNRLPKDRQMVATKEKAGRWTISK